MNINISVKLNYFCDIVEIFFEIKTIQFIIEYNIMGTIVFQS